MISTFQSLKNEHDVYRTEDCMKTFCKSFKKHAIMIINFVKKKMNPLTNGQKK